MNREQRRSMSSKAKKAQDYLESPCTITEAVQIARGVAEDVVTDFSKHTRPLQVSMSLQMEIMKSVMIEKGLITEDEFKARYIVMAEELQKKQDEMIAAAEAEEEEESVEDMPVMDMSTGDIEIKKI